MTGYEIGQRLDTGRVWHLILDADEREDSRLAVGRNLRAEMALLLVDHLAEPFLNVHVPRNLVLTVPRPMCEEHPGERQSGNSTTDDSIAGLRGSYRLRRR